MAARDELAGGSQEDATDENKNLISEKINNINLKKPKFFIQTPSFFLFTSLDFFARGIQIKRLSPVWEQWRTPEFRKTFVYPGELEAPFPQTERPHANSP